MTNKFYRVQGGVLVDGSTGPPAKVDRLLPWKPSDIGIDLSSPSYFKVPANTNFIAGSTFSSAENWIVDIGAVTQNLTIDFGGKNFYAAKFEVDISFDPTTAYSKAITGRRALLLQNFRYGHCQTFGLHGTKISDGININTTVAGSKLQLEHFRIEGLRENYYDTGSAVALIDAAQPQYNHPDCIQSYGGPSVLRVSNFYSSSDRSFHTISTDPGAPVSEVYVQRGHYKQLTHPVLGNQQTYPFFWTKAAGDPATWPGTYRNVYYEHGAGARTAATAFFPDGDAGYVDDVLAGGIIEAVPPKTAFWIPTPAEVGVSGTSPAYA